MALAYLDAINTYSKSLSVSSNELVLILLGNKLDLERLRQVILLIVILSRFQFDYYFRVIPRSDGETVAAKFSCAFCETTAADDYHHVQNLFHRTVREVRKERERIVTSHSLDEELPPVPIPSAIINPSLSSSSSSNSSIHFLTTAPDPERLLTNIIPPPPPPPIPTVSTPKSIKASASNSNVSRQSTPPSKDKRTQSKTSSVFSKIFK